MEISTTRLRFPEVNKIKSSSFIHLHDFPEDKIVVFLEDNYRKELINKAEYVIRKRNLMSLLKIRKLETIDRWKKAEVNRGKGWVTSQGIPLDKLKKISKLLIANHQQKFNFLNIEKHVTAYKSRGKSLVIKKPNLPIKESPQLFRVITHMIGDGSANEGNVNYFKNTDKEVYGEFARDLRAVFGNVQLSFNKDNIVFPITIRHILSKFYKVDFGTFTARLPKRVFDLPKQFAAAVTQAFLDDEGYVGPTVIRFYSFNEKLIQDVKTLLVKKFPEINAVSKVQCRNKVSVNGKRGVEYCFSINSEGVEKFYNLIGVTHLSKKKKIEFFIKRKYRKWNHRSKQTTKILILKSLIKRPKTTYELAEDTLICKNRILTHLNGYWEKRKKNVKGLVQSGFVKKAGIGRHGSFIWQITKKGVLNLIQNNKLFK